MEQEERGGFWAALGAAGLTVVGIQSFQLGLPSLWYDEAASVRYAGLTPGELLSAIHLNDAFFALYYSILHFWLAWSQSEVMLRSFSIVCSVGALVAIAALAARLGGSRAALAACAIVAFNPFAFAYGRQGRPYALLILVATLMSIAFLRVVERPSPRRWLAYVVLAIVGGYVHVMALLVVVAHALWVTLFRRALWREGFALAVVAVFVALVPLFAIVHGYNATSMNGYLERPSLHDLLGTLYVFAGSPKMLALVVVCMVAALAVDRSRSPRDRETIAFVALWLLVPLLVIFAVSQIKPMFTERYLAEAWPAFVLAVALAVAKLPRAAAFVAVLVYVALAANTLRHWYVDAGEDWRGATTFVMRHARPGDGVAVFPGNTEIAYDYYRRQFAASRVPLVYPAADPFPLVQEHFPHNESLPPGVHPRRLWVLIDMWAPEPEATADAQHFTTSIPHDERLVARQRFLHITVLLFARAPGPR